MNIIKLRKNLLNPNANQSVKIVNTGKSVIEASDSCQAMARVVFPKSFEPWTRLQEDALLSLFHAKTKSVHYSLMPKEKREQVIMKIAQQVGRSPCAVLARLRSLNASLSRSTVNLSSIVR